MHDATSAADAPAAKSDASTHASLSAMEKRLADLEVENRSLKALVLNLTHENKMLMRRFVGTKSEKTLVSDAQLAMESILAEEKALKEKLAALLAEQEKQRAKEREGRNNPENPKRKPTGRRDLSVSSLPRQEVIVDDPKLASTGRVIDYQDSYQLMRIPAITKVLHIKTAVYEMPTEDGTTLQTAERVKQVAPGIMHTSYIAFVAVQKFCMGVPNYRLAKMLSLQEPEAAVDETVMYRSIEHSGNTIGATVFRAMVCHTMEKKFLAVDATGVRILPGRRKDKVRRGCHKGHFFAIVSGDHILFHYSREHTQAAVREMLPGFAGYLQSDASNVYDIFNNGIADADTGVVLVGCFAHARRYFYDAALCGYAVGLEGLMSINELFRLERTLKALTPEQRKVERDRLIKPLAESFFDWVTASLATRKGRDLATRALGYAKNQRHELMRVFLDGHLELDNNRSERALRTPVVGRKEFYFFGSDDHAASAAVYYSMIASCRLHRLDPQLYLDEVQRIIPYWPRDRVIELAPFRWKETRARLNSKELERPFGHFTVPPPL